MSRSWDVGLASEQGRRAENQDAGVADGSLGYAVVADGMGGAPGGSRASSLAVEAASRTLAQALADEGAPPDLAASLRRAVAGANGAIFAEARATPTLRGMGTTLVVLAVRAGRFCVAGVGDSRAYRLRASELVRLTRDHSLVQARVDAGLLTAEEALLQPDRHVLTRAVGTGPTVEPQVAEGDALPGDLFVLTTDGVHGELPDGVLRRELVDRSPQAAAEALVAAALAAGSTDNATAAVLRVPRAP